MVPVTVSIGVAVFPRHARTGADVLDAADQALYAAKAAGRDTFVLAGASLPVNGCPIPYRPWSERWRLHARDTPRTLVTSAR